VFRSLSDWTCAADYSGGHVAVRAGQALRIISMTALKSLSA
jgi:hypothetical protein